MQPDNYATSGETNPAGFALDVSPNDSVDLSNLSRAIYIGGAGDLHVTMAGGKNDIIFHNLAAGMYYPIRASRIWSTGTTATDIIIMF